MLDPHRAAMNLIDTEDPEMDAARFDNLLRAWQARHSRRGLAGLLTGLALGGSLVLGEQFDATAKHKKKHKKKHGGAPPVPPPPPPASPPPPPSGPTCTDGLKNGSETDVDCGGGLCPRCADGKVCQLPNDCSSGTCTGGRCALTTTTGA